MARIQSFDELATYATQVIKYWAPKGQNICFPDDGWQYAKLARFPNDRYGYLDASNEVTPEGVHSSRAVQARWFNEPDFVCETTTPEEIAGKVWSYDR